MNFPRGKRLTAAVVTLLASVLGSSSAFAATILLLTGSGASSLNTPLIDAGFTVVNGRLARGSIAAGLGNADVVGVYIWNDNFGETFVPADPMLDFNLADQMALTTFAATHTALILDGLSWRGNVNQDEMNFSKNEALALAAAGGGVVLGADDASGGSIVQHVNQVAGWLGLFDFGGVYNTAPSSQVFGGSLLNTPNVVNPTKVVGTTTYSEVPNGMQPNGQFLSTAVFGLGVANNCCTGQSGFVPDLPSATFNGITYANVNHIVTTNIRGAGINPPPAGVPAPGALLPVALLALLALRKRRFART